MWFQLKVKKMYFAFVSGFGLTETTLAVFHHPLQHEVVPGSVGVVLPNTEVKVCALTYLDGPSGL